MIDPETSSTVEPQRPFKGEVWPTKPRSLQATDIDSALSLFGENMQGEEIDFIRQASPENQRSLSVQLSTAARSLREANILDTVAIILPTQVGSYPGYTKDQVIDFTIVVEKTLDMAGLFFDCTLLSFTPRESDLWSRGVLDFDAGTMKAIAWDGTNAMVCVPWQELIALPTEKVVEILLQHLSKPQEAIA